MLRPEKYRDIIGTPPRSGAVKIEQRQLPILIDTEVLPVMIAVAVAIERFCLRQEGFDSPPQFLPHTLQILKIFLSMVEKEFEMLQRLIDQDGRDRGEIFSRQRLRRRGSREFSRPIPRRYSYGGRSSSLSCLGCPRRS